MKNITRFDVYAEIMSRNEVARRIGIRELQNMSFEELEEVLKKLKP